MNALPAVLEENLDAIRALCKKYRVKRLTLFGSAAKGTFREASSDVDFVVELEWDPDPLERGRRYNELWKSLKRVLGRHVDLLEVTTIKNPYLAESIELTRRDLYAA